MQEYGLHQRNYENRTCLFLEEVELSQLAGMSGWSAGGMGRKQEDSSYVCLGSNSDPSFLSPRGKDGIWLIVALWLNTVSQERRLGKVSARSALGLSVQVHDKGVVSGNEMHHVLWKYTYLAPGILSQTKHLTLLNQEK